MVGDPFVNGVQDQSVGELVHGWSRCFDKNMSVELGVLWREGQVRFLFLRVCHLRELLVLGGG